MELVRNVEAYKEFEETWGIFGVPHIFFLEGTYHHSSLFAVKKHPPRRPSWGGRGGGREREEEEEEEEGLKLLRRPNYVGLNSVQWTPRAFLPFFLHNNLTHPMTPTLTPATTLALTLSALALTP